jgi:hypothetical protein
MRVYLLELLFCRTLAGKDFCRDLFYFQIRFSGPQKLSGFAPGAFRRSFRLCFEIYDNLSVFKSLGKENCLDR